MNADLFERISLKEAGGSLYDAGLYKPITIDDLPPHFKQNLESYKNNPEQYERVKKEFEEALERTNSTYEMQMRSAGAGTNRARGSRNEGVDNSQERADQMRLTAIKMFKPPTGNTINGNVMLSQGEAKGLKTASAAVWGTAAIMMTPLGGKIVGLLAKYGIKLAGNLLKQLLSELFKLFGVDENGEVGGSAADAMLQFDLKCILQKAEKQQGEYAKQVVTTIKSMATVKNKQINTNQQKGQ